MDAQDLVRSHSTGHESHGGVYVCSKCGWPFPNPHPSARHRRAHKRICGTIDGYKLVGLQENTQSDDEHSDDDRKTPSPKVLERSNNKKGSGLIAEGSVRSEDAVFSDAVAEFSDSGSGAGTGEGLEDVLKSATSVESVAKNDLNAIQSRNDGEINENTTNQLGYAPESEGSMSITSIDSMKRSESAVQDDRNGSEDDVHPITDVSEDSKKTYATDSVIESSLTSISHEGQVKEIEANDQDRKNLPYGLIAPNEVSSETAEGASKLESTVEVTSYSLRDIEVVPSEKEHIHVFDLDIPQIGLSPDVESVEHAQASVNNAENKVDTTDEIPCFNSGGLTESSNSKGEGSANVHVLSVPDGLPVVDNAEAMLEGFKTYKEEKLDQPTFLDSWEQFNDEENGVKNPVSNDNFQIFQSSNLSGGTVASSDMHDLEASHELDGGSSKPMVKEVPSEEANVSQIEIKTTENQGSYEKSPPADVVMPQVAKSLVDSLDGNSLSSTGINQTTHSVGLGDNEKDEKCDLSVDHSSKGPVEENVIDDGDHETEKYAISGDEYIEVSMEKIVAENPITSLENASCLSELQVNPTDIHNGDDSGDHDKGETEKSDISGIEVSMEKIVAENPITSLENASCLSKLQVNPTDIHNGDDSGDHDKGETEKSNISGNESRGGSIEENLLAKPKLNLDSGSNSSRADLNVVSDTKKSVMESEIDCNDKVQLEVGGITAAGSDHGPNLSSLATESSVPSFTAAEDNCSRELLGVSSGLTSQALQEESDKLVRQQTSSSALDVVDSISQTDSLEGNWGSVSVLSIQSDAQAVLNAEVVPPTDSQASLEEKAKLASERQYSNKSDTFEAPSFMTLVEPGGVDNQKATAAEMTAQNSEQPKPATLQAGWFPSITHVVNESQGRKKNEEIIAKVTNWSTGKQHTPLKNLLGEAYLENKAKSPNQKESQAPALQKDDKAVKGKDGGRVTTTVNSILAPESPTGQAPAKDNAKEWNSPARYPTEIKSEKPKAKGRPYWAQFLCCSSAHQHP